MKRKTNFFLLLLFTVLSSLLFFLANPNFVINEGLGFLAWFYYVPVLFVVKKSKLKLVWIFGFIYGFLSYGLYCHWLFASYRIFYFVIAFVFGIVFALVFLLLKLSEKLFTRYSFFIKGLILCSYEFVHTLGIFGFNYGVSCYTQYKYFPIIQCLDFAGPFGLNILIIFNSCIIYGFIEKLELKNNALYEIQNEESTGMVRFNQNKKYAKQISFRPVFLSAIIFGSLFTANIIYGILKIQQKENNETVKIIAVQSNENPWENGIEYYSKTIKNLIKLSDEALELYPEAKIVVWPETSVVPDITRHYYDTTDERRNSAILNLLKFINKKDKVFIIGNGHQSGERIYNSALIFTPGNNVLPPVPEVYSKVHLVPFSEYFPFRKIFPDLYEKLNKGDNNWWDAGDQFVSFKTGDLYFSTPICFEDTFPETGRAMFNSGARCLINLTNDSWANSKACQQQHMAMSVFRAVENRIPVIRAATSGETVSISCKGKIEEQIQSFNEDFLAADVEIHQKNQKTGIYTRTGDIFGYIPVILLFVLLIIKIFICIINKKRYN